MEKVVNVAITENTESKSVTVTKERIWEIVQFALYVVCFIGIILHGNEYDNQIFQMGREKQGAILLIFFFLLLFSIQRIRLINIPSLVMTIVFAAAAVPQIIQYAGASELITVSVLNQIYIWMAFLLIVDMAYTGRVRKMKNLSVGMFLFFAAVVVFFMTYRLGRAEPVAYVCFILLYLIPANEKDIKKLLTALVSAGLLSFIIVAIVSCLTNPFWVNEASFMLANPGQAGRWYGYFLNIGSFGQYLGFCFAMAVVMIAVLKEFFPKKPYLYVIPSLWIAGILFFAVLNGTRNLLIGIGMTMIVYLVFGWKKTKFPHLFIRCMVALLLLTGIGILVKIGIFYVFSENFDSVKLLDNLMKTPLKYFPAGAEYFVAKLVRVNDKAKWDTEFFKANTFLRFLDIFSSYRVTIWVNYLMNSTFTGSSEYGYMSVDYFVYNAHNEYVQIINQYGFLGGGLQILYCVSMWIVSIVKYVKNKKVIGFAAMIVSTMMLAMWWGEISRIYYPLTFSGIFLFAMLAWKEEKHEEAKRQYS